MKTQNTTTANANAQKEVQVINANTAAATVPATSPAPEKPAKGEKKAPAEKLDFMPALSYMERVRAGRDEMQSLNACFRATKNAYSFLQGLNFADFASHMNKRYSKTLTGKHNAKKCWSAWYAAQYAEAYIAAAAKDPKSIDHAASRNYLLAEKLQRDKDGLRML